MVYCAYIDVESRTSTVFNSDTGEITQIDGYRICDAINMGANTICFVPSVSMVKLIYPGGEVCGDEYCKNNDTDILIYKYGRCEFRSFGALICMQNVKSLQMMYEDDPICVAMYKYLCDLGNPEEIKYTLAYQAKKLFYADIKEELWEERKAKKKHYWDDETYWDMMSGVKSGMLSHYYARYRENVLMYDIRSAYQSVMINDNKFPVGAIVKIKCDNSKYKLAKLRNYIKNGKWCKLVFDGKYEPLTRYYDAKTNRTGLEYYNLLTLGLSDRLDDLYSYLSRVDWRLYYSKEDGYISKLVRDKVAELFRQKESLASGSFEKYLVKTEGETICGKGIQQYDFDDVVSIQDHYRGRGDNYFTPEMSLHCIAKIEFEMARAVKNTSAEYFDTDGIKVQNNESAVKYFEEENKRIMSLNIKSGYNIDIGTWKYEGKADRMLIFSPKIYIYECDGEIEFKAAGVDKDYKERIVNSIKGDVIMHMRKRGFPTLVRQYKYDCCEFHPVYVHGMVYGDLQKG